MTFDEFKILAKGMKAVYTDGWFLPDADALKVWFNLLQDLDYQTAQTAIQKYIMTNSKNPTIADIRKLAGEIVNGDLGEWGTEWQRVLDAVHYYGSYREAEALETLPELTLEATRAVGYRNICLSENISVERANFRQIFENLKERKTQEWQVSPKVKNLIGAIQGNLIEG